MDLLSSGSRDTEGPRTGTGLDRDPDADQDVERNPLFQNRLRANRSDERQYMDGRQIISKYSSRLVMGRHRQANQKG